ncbi:MAG: alpha/beta fold hydrolase [Vicinamibacterales bacterium]
MRTLAVVLLAGTVAGAQQGAAPNPGTVRAPGPAPDVAPAGIACEACPYPYPSRYLPLSVYGQDVRMAYMDVTPAGAANGHTVVLLHGNNFAGFYFGGLIDTLRAAGFRVVVPDQIGYGRSSKPAIPYTLHDMARNTRRLLEHLGIDRVMVVGHSMGGMAAARFATQNADMMERLVLYNPIGVTDGRFARRAPDPEQAYRQNLEATYQSIKTGLLRYVAHDPSAWNEEFERYARIRYAWTLGAEWPRLAMAQALIGQMLYADQVVNDWAHIQVPTLAFGGAEDVLPGSAALFQERMRFIADTIPDGRGRLLLLPGLGHVPHVEDPDRTYPPLVAFLREGL